MLRLSLCSGEAAGSIRGQKGSQGIWGPPGRPGLKGDPGFDGTAGFSGAKGEKGNPFNPSNRPASFFSYKRENTEAAELDTPLIFNRSVRAGM